MRGLRSIDVLQAAMRAVEIDLIERDPGDLGRPGWDRSPKPPARSHSSITLGGGGHGRGHDLGRADQADERAAREFRGRTIVEPSAMPLQGLTLGLLADLRPIHLGACAFLLCQLEAFGPDPIDEREIVADAEILEIFRLLLPPAA